MFLIFLQYQACDINCCCDNDCSDAEQKMFTKCLGHALGQKIPQELCYSPFLYSHREPSNAVESLFCVVKTNLPDKRNINRNKVIIMNIENLILGIFLYTINGF